MPAIPSWLLEPLWDQFAALLPDRPAYVPCTERPARPSLRTGSGVRRRTRPSQSDLIWRVAATLYLASEDDRYSCLDGALALWEGEFNEVTQPRPVYGLHSADRPGDLTINIRCPVWIMAVVTAGRAIRGTLRPLAVYSGAWAL